MRRNVLWREPDFLKLWAGQSVSALGSSITSTALPLTAVILLKATPFQMGLLSGAGAAVVLIFGLFAGAWADRLRRRPILIAADLARAIVLGSIPVAAALHRLNMTHLYVAGATASVLNLVFDASYQAYVPSLVNRENLEDCNAKLAVGASAADVGGPGLAGVLVAWITAPGAIVLDALSFVISAFSIALIRKPELHPGRVPRSPTLAEVAASPPLADSTQSAPQPNIMGEIKEGLRASWSNPTLRVLAQRTGTGSFFLGFGGALYMVFAIRELGLNAALLGVMISVGGATSLAGAFASPRLVARFGFGPTLVGAAVITGITMLVPTLAHGSVAVCASILGVAQLFDMAWPIFHINELSLRQAVTPDHLLGRVNSAMNMLFSGIMPLGALSSGLLAERLGLRTAMFLGALGYLLSSLWLVFSPIRRLRKLPEISSATSA